MDYQGTVIRPPSEADSIILQVTCGCSHNRCTFCGAYRDQTFRIKSDEIIDADLAFAARWCRRQRRVFLADGDVLSLSERRLVSLFTRIKEHLPWISRITLYGNAKNIRHKTVEQLVRLKELGLSRIYMGLESGHDPTLVAIKKGVTSADMVAAAEKVRAAGIFLSVTVLLGIAGKVNSQAHAKTTGEILSRMRPNQIAVLALMLVPGTSLYEKFQAGDFELPAAHQMLQELRTMLEHITVERAQFQANHASNYLSLDGRLPRDRQRLLALIDAGLSDAGRLKPENLRAL